GEEAEHRDDCQSDDARSNGNRGEDLPGRRRHGRALGRGLAMRVDSGPRKRALRRVRRGPKWLIFQLPSLIWRRAGRAPLANAGVILKCLQYCSGDTAKSLMAPVRTAPNE